MKTISKMESFKSFQISKKSMNQIAGSRTRSYYPASMNVGTEDQVDTCIKVVDDNDGNLIRKVIAERFADRC